MISSSTDGDVNQNPVACIRNGEPVEVVVLLKDGLPAIMNSFDIDNDYTTTTIYNNNNNNTNINIINNNLAAVEINGRLAWTSRPAQQMPRAHCCGGSTPEGVCYGGSLQDCLTDSELDEIIRPWLGDHYLPARLLFDVKNGHPIGDFVPFIRSQAERLGWLFLPAHYICHWATALIYWNNGDLHAEILDSAPPRNPELAAGHWAAFCDLLPALGIRDVSFVPHPKQPRDSNDCGLHVVWNAASCSQGDKRPSVPHRHCDTKYSSDGKLPIISLSPMRDVLSAWKRTGAGLAMNRARAEQVRKLPPAVPPVPHVPVRSTIAFLQANYPDVLKPTHVPEHVPAHVSQQPMAPPPPYSAAKLVLRRHEPYTVAKAPSAPLVHAPPRAAPVKPLASLDIETPAGGAPKKVKPTAPEVPRPVPLTNPDATLCYANAVVTAVAADDALAEAAMSRPASGTDAHALPNPSAIAPAMEYARRKKGKQEAVADLRLDLKTAKRGRYEQQDAHEFFLRMVGSVPQLQDKFRFLISSTVKREVGSTIVSTASMCLQVPIAGCSKIQEAIAAMTKPADVQMKDGAVVVTDSIPQVGPYLAVALNRYTEVATGGAKDSRPIEGLECISLAGAQFKPFAAVFHSGDSPGRGHYTADVLNAHGYWHAFDDANAAYQPAKPAQRLRNAYLVLYRRTHPQDGGPTVPRPADADQAPRPFPELDSPKPVPTPVPARPPAAVELVPDSSPEPVLLANGKVTQAHRKNCRQKDAYVHTQLVDAMITEFNSRCRDVGREVTFYPTDMVATIKSKAAHSSPTAYGKFLRKVAAQDKLRGPLAFVACVNRHFVTFVYDEPHGLRVYDSLRAHAPNDVRALAATVAKAVAKWRSLSADPAVTIADCPQQAPGSNDCAMHALSNAWFMGNPSRVMSRDDVADLAVPEAPEPIPPVAVGPVDTPLKALPEEAPPQPDEVVLAWAMLYAGQLVQPSHFATMKEKCKKDVDSLLVHDWHDMRTNPFYFRGANRKDNLRQIEVRLRVRAKDAKAAMSIVKKIVKPKDAKERVDKIPQERAPHQIQHSNLRAQLSKEDIANALIMSYTVIEPNDVLRRQPFGASFPVERVLLGRFRDDHGRKAVACPVCVAQGRVPGDVDNGCPVFPISKAGPMGALRRHLGVDHNCTPYSLNTVACPCDTDCGGDVRKKAACQPDKADGKVAFEPHRDMTLCAKCNMWHGNRAPDMKPTVHPCLPPYEVPDVRDKDTPFVSTFHEPWEIPPDEAERDRVPATPDSHDDDAPDPAVPDPVVPPDFYTGEGDPKLPPLAQASAARLTALAWANPDFARAPVRKGLAYATRLDHVKMLHNVAEEIAGLPNDSNQRHNLVARWLIGYVERQSRKRDWNASTKLTNISSIQSAMHHLPLYMPTTMSWRLYEDSHWKMMCRNARIRAAQDLPDQALPATTDQVFKACKLAAVTNAHVAASIALTWVTSARSSQIVQLKAGEVDLIQGPDGSQIVKVVLCRGKSNRLQQQANAVHADLGDFARFVVPILERRTDPNAFLFPAPSRQQRKDFLGRIKDSLRNANNEPRLENRSLRRGSLQSLALSDASSKVLLACSGHSTVKSLKRYLNFGRIVTSDTAKNKKQMEVLSKVSKLALTG